MAKRIHAMFRVDDIHLQYDGSATVDLKPAGWGCGDNLNIDGRLYVRLDKVKGIDFQYGKIYAICVEEIENPANLHTSDLGKEYAEKMKAEDEGGAMPTALRKMKGIA